MIQTASDLGLGVRQHRTDTHAPFQACRGCKVRGSRLCHIIQDEPVFGTKPPIIRRFSRGTQLFKHDSSSGFLGVVRRGYVRRSVMKLSGRRVLMDFGLPGDIIAGLPEWGHHYDLEAVSDIEICTYDSATIKRQMEANQSFRRMILQEIDHQHHRLLGLLWRNGTLTSRERIIAFLVMAVDYMPTELLPDGGLILSMEVDRSDWADLTNTAVETISRTMRYLEEKNLVTSLTPYRFRIRDLDLLATFAGEDPPATRVGEYDRPKRIETHFGSPISRDRMTAVNAAARGADRVNAVMKPMSMHERDLARRRPEDVQEKVRD